MNDTESSETPAPSAPVPRLHKLLAHRHGGTMIFIGLFMLVGMTTRLALALKSHDGVAWDGSFFGALAIGALFDLAMGFFFAAPLATLLAFAPRRVFASKFFRGVLHGIFIFALLLFLFGAVSEWLFWDEFGVRFNFIAVDYLVYTTEVVRNINESYNIPAIFAGIALLAVAIWVGVLRSGVFRRWVGDEAAQAGRGRFAGLALVLLPVFIAAGAWYARGGRDMRSSKSAGGFCETMSAGLRHMSDVQPSLKNAFNTELAKNGPYAFVAAFWSNELDYDTFYPMTQGDAPYKRLREMLKQDNATFTSDDPRDITRRIVGDGPEKRMNVIQITVESLSAEYLGCYNESAYGPMGLTPNLDRIAGESLWFRHTYAGGTRTVRGMEALTLSIPPIPGQAVLRRPHCENMPTLGAVFQDHGYDCDFVYGGDGLFDNMSYFFANNGYRVMDKPARLKAYPDTKVKFANAWGVSDEDLYDWVIDEADASFAKGEPFHEFVMTTSNHRPFTWPAGRIPLLRTGRDGGVAYTDYAIGKFLRDAEKKPWFKNTIFVIVADHCASVAGKRELEVRKYEIPMFIYSPGNIRPRMIETPTSQIDLAPTVLGLLNFNYTSRFFGKDALRPSPAGDRVFISNYQKIAMIRGDRLAVLKPVRQSVSYQCDRATGELSNPAKKGAELDDAAVWYQCASDLFKTGKLTRP